MSSLPKGKSLVAVRALERLFPRVNPLVLPEIDLVKPKNDFFLDPHLVFGSFIVLRRHPSRK
jgi:hypothetical protein